MRVVGDPRGTVSRKHDGSAPPLRSDAGLAWPQDGAVQVKINQFALT